MNKTTLAAALSGNILEWYDFGLFLYLAPILSQHFFRFSVSNHSLLITFMVFAAGFIMRPVGAILFGHSGDRIGRAQTLRYSILAVSALALSCAVLPGMEFIGGTATVLMIAIRLLQGLCLGGEFAGSMVYLAETASQRRAALFSSLTNNGSNIGLLLATAVIAVLNALFGSTAFADWGWRFAFAAGGVIGLVSFSVRYRFIESSVFLNEVNPQPKQVPCRELFRHHKAGFVAACGLMFITTSGCYTFMNLISTYLHETLQFPLQQAITVQSTFLAVSLLLVPLAGWLGDRFGCKRVLWWAVYGYVLLSVPCYFGLSATKNCGFLLPILLVFCLEQGCMPAMLASIFPPSIRYTGVSLSYNLTAAMVGGTAPLINMAMIQYFHLSWILAIHMVISALIAAFSLFALSSAKDSVNPRYLIQVSR